MHVGCEEALVVWYSDSMQSRAVRLVLLALLLVAGTGAALVAWTIDGQQRVLEDGERDIAGRVDGLLALVADIAAAQHAYVAPGQPTQPAFERSAARIQEALSALAALRPLLRTAGGSEILAGVEAAASDLVDADSSARNHLGASQTLWAAEVIFEQARDAAASLTDALRRLRAAERAALVERRASLTRELWLVLGGAALVWTLGLGALVRLPGRQPTPEPVAMLPTDALAVPQASPPGAALSKLTRAAEVCTAIARLSTAEDLSALLARTADVVDASGIVIWMGAGDRLFVAASHGYEPALVGRLGTIQRSAENATATAWRTAEVRIVATDGVSPGAIVAPLPVPAGCAGVLAAEIRNGGESAASTRAVLSMIAAQFAAALSAWPASEASGTPAPPAGAGLREASGL